MKHFIFLAVFSFFGFQMLTAQDYTEQWRELETFEAANKLEDAQVILDDIASKAKRNKDETQLVKVFIFQSKFWLVKEEDAQKKVIAELDQRIASSKFPERNIYYSIKGQLLQQYLDENRWRINDRTNTEAGGDDFMAWDLKTFYSEISGVFQKSLADSDKLSKINIADYDAILQIKPLGRELRPSLLDVLAHHALDFYKTSAYGITMPRDNFTVTKENGFLPTEELIKLKRPANDTLYSSYDVIQLYATLEQLHKKRNEIPAYLGAVDERLEFVKDQVINNEDLPQLVSLYNNLIIQYAENGAITMIQHSLAEYYFQRSNNAENDNKLAHRQQAISIAKAAIEKHPETYGSLQCTRLLSQIYQPSLSSQLQSNIIPNKPSRGVISYRNATDATVYYIKVAQDYDQKKGLRDSIHNATFQKALKANSFAHLEVAMLPKGDDTFDHTYEYAIPGLEKGKYLVLIKQKNQVKLSSGTFMDVSNLALSNHSTAGNTVFTATERDTGKPMEDVIVNIFNDEARTANYRGKTNKDGQVSFLLNNEYYNRKVEASKNGDTLSTRFYNSYYRDNSAETEKQVKAFIYLDRAIYRPGQKVYFKSIVVENENNRSRVLPNESFKVVVEDVNGKEIFTQELVTNAYGSVNGSFNLPSEVLTGEFSIYLESDEEGSYWDNVDDYMDGDIYFQVEEYKRPRFKTDFKEVTETYIIGDSVKVTGFAKALLGSNITDAPVVYTVTRIANVPYWKYGYIPVDQQVIANDTTITKADGTFTIPFKALPDSTLVAKDIESNYNYRIEASVTDINGETRTAETTVRVGYKPIEVQISRNGMLTVKNNEVQVIARNLNGKPVNATIELQIRSNINSDHVIVESGLEEAEFHELNLQEYRNQFPVAELRKEEKTEDWKNTPIIFKTTITTDSLTTIKIPITQQWKNGNYIIYAKAVEAGKNLNLDNEKGFVEEKQEAQIWANKDLPATPSIISHDVSVDGDQAIVNFYTSTDGVYIYLTTYDSKRILESKWIYLPNGKTTMKFAMGKALGKALKFQYHTYKYNDFRSGSFEATKPVKPTQQFAITTQAFRNKLYPGENEEWSFTIKDQDSTGMQAEVLASMYDKSLDEFASSSWSGFSFYNRNYDFYPSTANELAGATTVYVSAGLPYVSAPSFSLDKEQLNLYGLTFKNFEYRYRDYKRTLWRKLTPVGPIAGKIVGKVTDASGSPILGALILIKGTNIATTTDFDGNYVIDAEQGDSLVISFSGYDPASILVKGAVENISLETSLDAVVVQAYRTTAKISSPAVEDRPNASVTQRLEGQVAGLNVISGQPGANTLIQLRGASSVNGDSEPLIIVDGVPMTEAEFRAIDPNNVQEVAVLKDANATSIYGNRGANGVIIISTKKGVSTADIVNEYLALQNVQVRKNLDETAFFLPELYTDEKGNLKFSFTSPEALTQWKFRLFAHNKQAQTAQFEGMVQTQKELSLVPNPPRFLRETDTIRFSTKVANLSGKPMSGKATLKLFDALTMQPIDQELGNAQNIQSFEAATGGNASVNWTFHIPKGTQAVTYRVLATSGNFSDGEENTLPVLTNRMLVTESRALWVRAGETESVTLDKLANSPSSTRTNHQLTFEYTSNPSWYAIQSLPYLMEFEHECSEQTFSRYYSNAVAAHILNSNPKVKEVFESWAANDVPASNLEKNEELKSVILAHTPWLRDAQSEAEKQKRLATLFDLARTAREKKKTLAKLEAQQMGDGGFPWFAGGRFSEYITRHIAAGIGHLNKLEINDGDRPQTDRIYENAIKALDRSWEKSFNEYLKTNKTLDKYIFGVDYWHYQYARSFMKDQNLTGVLKTGREFAFAKAETNFSSQSIYQQLLMSISLERAGNGILAEKIVEGLRQTAVNSHENGMYWKENVTGYNWYSSNIETQALAIETFSEVGNNDKNVEELKVWLLQNKRTNRWKSTKATADATYALLLQGNQLLDVQESNVIKWGDKAIPESLMADVKKEAGTGYFKVSLKEEEVKPVYAKVEVKNESEVTGYGGLYWQYFEDLDKITVDDDLPMSIKKRLFKKVNTDSGKRLVEITADDALEIGDLVTVRMEIRSTKDLDFVHLKDMRASGFEPVDVISKYKYQDGLGYYQSTKDVATHFFFDQLKPGTYVFEYDVRANNAGQFSNGITELECMYAPEFSSHSEGVRVTIKE
ncbi:TonB-dependent outer membrane receptor, SusC/RagA subfamily, signature region [Nonlabens sp. Hel1_33_55]|uniref:alpha-2-macroglobulin family protein n=1 Tax=Nonlabens sp. Hel1_33_55 TaxID=1336802 RepID=UPI000875C4DB|nr:MG2 domain-containing protein [Nonlabens sp. Hel1_33_55]SCY40384.1 TonB-dependent outer membrane receptor, SusC/RagA subfamily, signature region [Nonlabens sp. Hel1_33_55]